MWPYTSLQPARVSRPRISPLRNAVGKGTLGRIEIDPYSAAETTEICLCALAPLSFRSDFLQNLVARGDGAPAQLRARISEIEGAPRSMKSRRFSANIFA
jgi:hypothetical protein